MVLSLAPIIRVEEEEEKVLKVIKKTKMPTVGSLKDFAKDDSDFASEDSDVEGKVFSTGLRFSNETYSTDVIHPTPIKNQVTTVQVKKIT